jgi:dynein heavy chain, axonemal
VYVFGGHGGIDYQRIAFNDLYTLDIDKEFEWNKLSPKGNPPDARGGHTASVLATKDKIMFFGGWSFTSQFSNVMIYDITNDEWVDPEIAH